MHPGLDPLHARFDELHLASLVLRALETGRLRMDAEDYQAISIQAAALLDECDTGVLLRVRREGPKALREIAENLLDDRGAFDSAAHDPHRHHSRLLSELLLSGLRTRRRS